MSLNPQIKQRITQLHSTQLTVRAVVDIAQERRSKFVFGIGKPWTEILALHGHQMQQEELHKPRARRFSHRFSWTKVGPDALPIIVYVSDAGGMRLPRDPEAVALMRQLMAM